MAELTSKECSDFLHLLMSFNEKEIAAIRRVVEKAKKDDEEEIACLDKATRCELDKHKERLRAWDEAREKLSPESFVVLNDVLEPAIRERWIPVRNMISELKEKRKKFHELYGSLSQA